MNKVVTFVVAAITTANSSWLFGAQIKGRAYDYASPTTGLAAATVTASSDGTKFQSTTNINGVYDIANALTGTFSVTGELEHYVFPVEDVTLQGAAKTIDLPAMNTDPTGAALLAGQIVKNAQRFANREIGYMAEWAMLSRFNLPPHRKALVCRNIVEIDQVASAIPVIQGYATNDERIIFSVEDAFASYIKRPKESFPKNRDELAGVVSVDIARHTAATAPGRNQPAFLNAFGNAWGDNFARRAALGVRIGAGIRKVRYSVWDASYRIGDQQVRNKLTLIGDSGIYRLLTGETGKLSHIRYFDLESKIAVWGNWSLSDEAGWFALEVFPSDLTRFTGVWGRGETIGENESQGTWEGKAANQ